MSGACESQLSSALFDRLSSKTYHVAFVDLMFNECGLALADKLGAPAVGFGFSLTSGPQEFSTLDTLPSYVPVLLSHLPDKMTFLQRTYNLLVKASSRLYMYYYTAKVDTYLRRLLGPGPNAKELQGGLSGVLVNTDWALDYPRSYPPSYRNIGGLQIKKDPGSPPANMLQFMEGSGEHGVILFTMGFIFDPSAVPAEVVATRHPAVCLFQDPTTSDLQVRQCRGGQRCPRKCPCGSLGASTSGACPSCHEDLYHPLRHPRGPRGNPLWHSHGRDTSICRPR